MPASEPLLTLKKDLWLDRLQAFLEVLLLSGVVSSVVASFSLSLVGARGAVLHLNVRLIASYVLLESLITLVLLVLVMKSHEERFRDLGLRGDQWITNSVLGLGLVPIFFFINLLVAESFRVLGPQYFNDRNPLMETIRTPQDLIFFMVAALLAGGVKEELQRAFILTRFRDQLGGAKLGLILWSFAFGAGHYLQGLQGAVAAGLFGLLFGIVYLVRGSLVAPMVAHGVYDTLVLLSYWYLKGAAKTVPA